MRLETLDKDELLVLGVIAAIAEREGSFDPNAHSKRFVKLVFLACHGAEDNGKLALRVEPRCDIQFRVYLYGVTSRDALRILDKLIEKKVLEQRLDGYVPRVNLQDILKVAERLDPELRRGIELAKEYAGMTGKELEGLVNSLLGLYGPEYKAIVYGVNVHRLLEARAKAAELAAEGMLVDA